MVILTTEDTVNIMRIVVNTIQENQQYFCDLDSVAGDGDFGTSLEKGFSEIKAKWNSLDKSNIGTFMRDCGMIIMEKCGGATGPIWGNAFLKASRYSKDKVSINIKELSEFFQSMVDGVKKVGKAELGDKTLLDSLIPFTNSLAKSAENGEHIEQAFSMALKKAEEGSKTTKTMVASKGRARYLGARSIGAYDPGARAVVVILSNINEKFFDNN